MNYNLSNFSSSIKSLNTKYHTQLLINRYDYIQKRIKKQIKKNKAQKRLGIELNNNVDYSFLHSKKFDQLMNSGFMLSSPNFINLLNEALQDYIQKEYTPKSSNYSSLIQKIDDVLPYLISIFDEDQKVKESNKLFENNNPYCSPRVIDFIESKRGFFGSYIKEENRYKLAELIYESDFYNKNEMFFNDKIHCKKKNYGIFFRKLIDLKIMNNKSIQTETKTGVKNIYLPMAQELFGVKITESHFVKIVIHGIDDIDVKFYEELSFLNEIHSETNSRTNKTNS